MPTLLIVCPLVFLGALIDAIAGGGGLITLPAYLLAGLPAHVASGTNKLSASISTTASVLRFGRGGNIHLPTVAAAAAGALLGAALGTRLALYLSARVLQAALLICLPVMAVFLLTRKAIPDDDQDKAPPPLGRALPMAALAAFLVGAYDGLFGPGAGTFYILSFTFLTGLRLRTAMGNAKVVNLASNLSSLVTWGTGGQVAFAIGLPAALFGLLGSYIGAGLALKNGAKIFRPVMIIVFCLLLATVAWQFFSGMGR